MDLGGSVGHRTTGRPRSYIAFMFGRGVRQLFHICTAASEDDFPFLIYDFCFEAWIASVDTCFRIRRAKGGTRLLAVLWLLGTSHTFLLAGGGAL